jgi:hypothetical protein
VAFPLEKGGFNILFDALSTNGRVLLLPERPRSDNSNTESWPSDGRPPQLRRPVLRRNTVPFSGRSARA